MKTLVTIAVAICATMRAVAGDALKDTIRGGIYGAAAGALVSGISDDYDARYAIPFFSGLGALTGYAVHHYRHSERGYYGPRRRHPVGYAYGLPYLALPYAWHAHRPRYYYHVQPAPEPSAEQRRLPPPAPVVNRHPGVRLIAVDMPLPNGGVVPITIMKLGDRYVGPRGESYDTLPDADILRERYHP